MNQLLFFKQKRRTFWVLSGFLFFSASLFAQPVPELLYYDFNAPGPSIPNLASNPPVGTATATIVGGQTIGAGGACNTTGLVGTGGSASVDYVNTGWATSVSGAFTMSFYTSNITPSTTLFYIIGDGSASSFRVFTNGVAGANNWIVRGPINDVLIPGGATIAPHFNTIVYDDVAGEIRAYVDGALVNTVTQAPPTISGTGPFRVGGYSSGTGLNAGGIIDDFRFYSRALTPAEVLEITSPGGSSTQIVSSCDSYYWAEDSMTYTTSGTYSTTVLGVSGCDSTIFLDLTINTAATGPTDVITACDSYFWNGLTYTASGMYYDTLVGVNGCDSINTLDLTINFSPSAIENVTECDSYVWPVDGNTYNSSGTYSYYAPGSAVPCDSMYMLVLTINSSSSSTITETAIDSYTAPSGAVYTSSGTYTDVIPNAAGCDSTITINLTVEYTGINEIAGVNYVVYPNPADDQIQIDGLEGIAELREVYITSVSGTRVMKVENPFEPIRIGQLETGTYFLQIQTSKGTSTVQFVKQ